GSQNAWLRQIHNATPLYVPRSAMAAAGLADGDWAWVISRQARILAPVRGMSAVNPRTVWTWNAIAKRAGAWGLDTGAPEAKRAAFLNPLIHELLPPRGDGMRWSNSDPITGQAAWFDLRVRLEKASAADIAADTAARIARSQASPVATAPEGMAFDGRHG
ncbi:MAG: formate dehydrogenase, partial [Pseudomonadota bacterium]